MASRHCPIPHHQAASNGAQGRFNAADVRTMMGIDQLLGRMQEAIKLWLEVEGEDAAACP